MGLSETPMPIPDVNFAGLAAALGATALFTIAAKAGTSGEEFQAAYELLTGKKL